MSTYVPVELQRAVRAHFADCCAYCRTLENLTVTTFEFEHILPLSAGGKTALENLCLSCPSCNRFKATRTVAPDPLTGQVVPLFHPVLDRWADHFVWNEDATAMTGLTATGRATIAMLRMNRPVLIRLRRMWVSMSEHPPDVE